MRREPCKLADGEFDLLVIGGGISGACVARDATLRGLRVAVVDGGDFGASTSANSLRIVHGGLRYLQQWNLRRMRQSIGERSMWLRTAPHLVHPLECMVATTGRGARSRAAMRTALLVNDFVGFDRNRGLVESRQLPAGRVVGREEACTVYPGVDAERMTGGAIWYDAQMHHSERLTLSVVLDAAAMGATVVNYVRVERLAVDGKRVVGARSRDVLTGDAFDVRAKLVVNTGGPAAERLIDEVSGGDTLGRSWEPAKAINVLVQPLAGKTAVGVPIPVQGAGRRMIFATPWRGLSLVGTAYYPVSGESESCHATDDEVATFIEQINAACPGASLATEDVVAVQAGVMPVKVLRRGGRDVRFLEHHQIVDHHARSGVDGLVSLVAVKYTTARLAAKDVVDLVFRKLGRRSPGCVTALRPVRGGNLTCFDSFVSEQVASWSDSAPEFEIRKMARLYGTELSSVLGLCANRGGGLLSSTDVGMAAAEYGARFEMVAKLGDFVFRRTDLACAGHPGIGPITAAGETLGVVLGWSADRVRTEVDDVLAELRARRCSVVRADRESSGDNDRAQPAMSSVVGHC